MNGATLGQPKKEKSASTKTERNGKNAGEGKKEEKRRGDTRQKFSAGTSARNAKKQYGLPPARWKKRGLILKEKKRVVQW